MRKLVDLQRSRLRFEIRKDLNAESFLRDVMGINEWEENGDEMIIRCPLPWGLHKSGDSSPSFAFNREKLLANCFVCGGGDIFWLVQNSLAVNSAEAAHLIKSVLRPKEYDTADDLLKDLEKLWQVEDLSFEIPTYSERIITRWVCQSRYLDARGVPKDIQYKMRTGVDLNHKDEFVGEMIVQPRLVIPHFWQGKLVGWVKRRLADAMIGPKYVNSATFPRKETLYNFDNINPLLPVIVVESPMSVLLMMRHGYENVVATFGSKVSESQVWHLRTCNKVILWLDGDLAGYNGTRRVIPMLEPYTDLWVVDMPPDLEQDPGDLDAAELASWLEKAVPSVTIDVEDPHALPKAHHREDRRHAVRTIGRGIR